MARRSGSGPPKRERPDLAGSGALENTNDTAARDNQPRQPAQAARRRWGADLLAEYIAALRCTTTDDLQPLRDAGVDGAGLAFGMALARISVSRTGFYQPDPDGGPAFLIPVRVENVLTPEAADPVDAVRHGEIVDLLAFSPAFPRRWALRTGAATWLGAVEPQYLNPSPTPIWRSPLHWLGSDCHGLVLLSRDKRDRYRTLTCLDAIVAEDEDHAAVLRKLLKQPWLSPPVDVRRSQEVRNAAANSPTPDPFTAAPELEDEQPKARSRARARQKPNGHTQEAAWLSGAQRDQKLEPIPNLFNTMLAMRGDPNLRNAFAYDEMLRAPMLVAPCRAPNRMGR